MSDSVELPTHVGLILDGNRRWAKAQGLPTLEGHRRGYDNLKKITKAAINRGVLYVSAYIFSTKNWNRTAEEVNYLMDLALILLKRDVKELNKDGIRVVWLGSRERLSQKLLKAITNAEESTEHNTRGTLGLCFNYSGRQEIADAARTIAEKGVSPGKITPDMITEALYAPQIPPVDLMIRTSGEQRISDFMLWRAAYAELYFVQKHWPAFTEDDLEIALAEFALRQRRFGS